MNECSPNIYFTALDTVANKPRNRHILGACTVSKQHKLKKINYQYSLVFANFTTLFHCIYEEKS